MLFPTNLLSNCGVIKCFSPLKFSKLNFPVHITKIVDECHVLGTVLVMRAGCVTLLLR